MLAARRVLGFRWLTTRRASRASLTVVTRSMVSRIARPAQRSGGEGITGTFSHQTGIRSTFSLIPSDLLEGLCRGVHSPPRRLVGSYRGPAR